MPGGDLAKALVDRPVELDIRVRPPRIAQRGQRVDQVAERRELDKQDAPHAGRA